MMSQVDADIELPEAQAAFGSVTGWTAAPPVPFKPLARPHLGTADKSQHWPTTMTRWGNLGNNNGRRGVYNDVWEKVRKHKKTIQHWCLMVLLTFFFFFFFIFLKHTHTHRHTTARRLGRHILPWWSWLRGLHSAHADGCWGTLPLPWWWLAGGHSHCHGDDGRSQACQPMRWWIDAMQEAKGKRD